MVVVAAIEEDVRGEEGLIEEILDHLQYLDYGKCDCVRHSKCRMSSLNRFGSHEILLVRSWS